MFLLALGAPRPTRAGVNQWTPTGPPAAVTSLATDPAQEGMVYASSPEGIWRSADHAVTWTLLGPLPAEIATVVAADPFDPANLLAGQRHLFRSQDGGASWSDVTPTGTYNGLIEVGALRFDAALPNRVYVVSQDFGVFRSDDGGSTWTRAGDLLGAMDLAIDPADSRTLFVGTDSGKVFQSLDSGDTWTETTRPGHGHNLLRVALVGPTASVLFAVPYCCGDLYRSFDGGEHWSTGTPAGPQGLPTSVAVDLRSPASVYLAVQPPPSPPEVPPPFPPPVSRSTDGGATWTPLTNGLPRYTFPWGLVIDSTGTYLHAIGDEGTWTLQLAGGGIATTVPTLSPALLAVLAVLIAAAGAILLLRA